MSKEKKLSLVMVLIQIGLCVMFRIILAHSPESVFVLSLPDFRPFEFGVLFGIIMPSVAFVFIKKLQMIHDGKIPITPILKSYIPSLIIGWLVTIDYDYIRYMIFDYKTKDMSYITSTILEALIYTVFVLCIFFIYELIMKGYIIFSPIKRIVLTIGILIVLALIPIGVRIYKENQEIKHQIEREEQKKEYEEKKEYNRLHPKEGTFEELALKISETTNEVIEVDDLTDFLVEGVYERETILWEDDVRQKYDVYKYLEPIPNEIHSDYIEGIWDKYEGLKNQAKALYIITDDKRAIELTSGPNFNNNEYEELEDCYKETLYFYDRDEKEEVRYKKYDETMYAGIRYRYSFRTYYTEEQIKEIDEYIAQYNFVDYTKREG